MKLSDKQQQFTKAIGQLIAYAYSKGYGLTVGDAYRDYRAHGQMGEKKSYAAANSVHKVRLAMDFNLFVNGEWISNGDHPAWKDLGQYWGTLHGEARWGGEWNDANHFSFEYGGHR